MDTTSQITLSRVSDTRATTQSVQYRERLWVPWWWSLPAALLAGVIAFEIGLAAPAIPAWLPYLLLFGVAGAVLMWFSKTELKVVRDSAGDTELWIGDAHLPTSHLADRGGAAVRQVGRTGPPARSCRLRRAPGLGWPDGPGGTR